MTFETKIISGEKAAKQAGDIIRNGGLVAIPTETVYGLAANALSPAAVASIFTVKGRPQDNPLIVHISQIDEWAPLVSHLPDIAIKLGNHFWPGPLTIILEKSDVVPLETTGGLSSVAVRIPQHAVARNIISAAGVPVAAPSANLSGKPSPTTAGHCYHDLGGKIPLVVDGGACQVGIESTVLSLLNENVPTVLRPGAITAEQIEDVTGLKVQVASFAEGERVLSPGQKYRHYSPKAPLIAVKGDLDDLRAALVNAPIGSVSLVFAEDVDKVDTPCIAYGKDGDAQSLAHGLFYALREADRLAPTAIYIRMPDRDILGIEGVINRIERAVSSDTNNVK